MKTVIKVVVAMVCIAGMEMYAMSQGINGDLLRLAFIVIGGLAGYLVASKEVSV